MNEEQIMKRFRQVWATMGKTRTNDDYVQSAGKTRKFILFSDDKWTEQKLIHSKGDHFRGRRQE